MICDAMDINNDRHCAGLAYIVSNQSHYIMILSYMYDSILNLL